ncbi:Exocyst complex component S5 [Coniosporium tulheliwenetii]|uniref:Exocyst complex component S5 n=1 Tax=Coniosporium tulheliwenetii TaxID=3383036 RepID=A0ACC2YNY5_9PEZI|nr:Exocyst complex component S5 [Cladosporium sp. JES 115]
MADTERVLLNHYNLKTLSPSQWPAEKDESDTSDEESPRNHNVRRSKSRYSVLERGASYRNRSSVPGTQKTSEGRENLVQQDEPDPLGASRSVVQVLRQRGLPVDDDLELRNRFLLSSNTFAPTLFLSQVHSEASTEALLQGLDFLSRSIEKKSASLKDLVESNFERFVRAKATIDNVYMEMRNQGAEPESARPRSGHARTTSRTGGHMRNASNPLSPLSPTRGMDKPWPNEKKKNALAKESEYGVLGIKAPLLEAAVKAEELWGPALGERAREETIKATLSTIEQNRALFEIGASIHDCIKRKDHVMLVEEYAKARRYAENAKGVADNAVQNRVPLTDPQIHQIIVTARMWSDVEEQIEAFKRDVWRRLAGTHFTKQKSLEEDKPEEHMELIKVLLELGVEQSPIDVWLFSRYDYLKSKITAVSERMRIEIEILRRRLANGDRPTQKQLAAHLRSVNEGGSTNSAHLDSQKVIEFWEHVHDSLAGLLSSKGACSAKSSNFGKPPSPLSMAEHSARYLSVLMAEAENIIVYLPTALETYTREPANYDKRFKFDPNNLPPPSPSRGEAWEKYAFWPPYATSLSGAQYLSRIHTLIGTAASDLARLSFFRDGRTSPDELRHLVSTVRERCNSAVCAAWDEDSAQFKLLETWTRSVDHPHLTTVPERFMAFEMFMLNGLQKIMYLSDVRGAADVITSPSAKPAQVLKSTFMNSLYKTLSGMVENAERGTKSEEDMENDADGITKPASGGMGRADSSVGVVDAGKKSIRLLLTLSNLQQLQRETVPQLLSQYETLFSASLSTESQTLRDVLSQLESRLFTSYLQPIIHSLSRTIHNGILSASWPPPPTPPTPVCTALIEAFKLREEYDLLALMQATLDTEFLAQTLGAYTTDKASQVQSNIYTELDARTSEHARRGLQSELGGLRGVLKGLREGTRVEL